MDRGSRAFCALTFIVYWHRENRQAREIVPFISKPLTTYGFREEANVRAVNTRADGGRMRFEVLRQNGVRLPPLDITLNAPGNHNVQNALAAIAVATELGVDDNAICTALAHFTGVGRRFQRHGEVSSRTGGTFTLVDDYGHHPAEMAATLDAARGAFPGRRVVLAFQPHRYTRTRDVFEDFVKVLSNADVAIIGEVYAAGEQPIVAADGRALARAVRVAGKVEPIFVENIEDMPDTILGLALENDVVITMGAGSIGGVPGKLLELMR